MAAEKSNWSFKFSFHRRMNLSIIFLGVLFLAALITTIAVKIIVERRDRMTAEKNTPKVNTEKWQKDLLLYHDKTGKFPKNFRELELVVWNNNDATRPTQLTNGESLYVFDNYMYQYYADEKDGQVASLWAVPVGEKKAEANTFYVLLTPKGYQMWKGLPFNDLDIDRIPKKAIPLDSELARLGMSKQILEDKSSPQKSILSPFGFGKK